MIINFILAFISSLFFAVLCNAPRKELLFCGLTGGISFVLFKSFNYMSANAVFASFIGAVGATACSRFLSHFRKAPATLFLIPGILPLVPGAGMYYTMNGILKKDIVYFYARGVETLEIAGVIAVGIMIVLSLPYGVFSFIKFKD